MFNQNGLSLDQAPPISVVFRLFFIGGVFGIISGISILFYGIDILDASSVAGITFTHILTLGVMLSFIFGALFQMLPVIAGVTIKSPTSKSNWLLYPFILGVISLLLAFNYSNQSYILFTIASILLGISILTMTIIMLKDLLKLKHHSSSSKGMSFAIVSLMITVILAIYLTLTLSGYIDGEYYSSIKEAHYSFGLFAWVSLLIISISFQVIEMFYVTPAYPKIVGSYLALTIFILVLISSLFQIQYLEIVLAIILIGYGALTLKRLTQRKRPLTDATVWFWRIGLSSLILSMIFIFLKLQSISYIFFASFALSIIFAMFYKIVPFLTWFHLNSQGYFKAPMMHEVIHPKTAKKHLWIHISTIISFIISSFFPIIIYLSALLTILSFSWITYQVVYAHFLYIKTQKSGEKFNMMI